jgi:hypothetical protein
MKTVSETETLDMDKYPFMHICIHIYIHIFIYMYICMNIFVSTRFRSYESRGIFDRGIFERYAFLSLCRDMISFCTYAVLAGPY